VVVGAWATGLKKNWKAESVETFSSENFMISAIWLVKRRWNRVVPSVSVVIIAAALTRKTFQDPFVRASVVIVVTTNLQVTTDHWLKLLKDTRIND